MQVMGEATGLCVAFCSEITLTLRFCTEKLKVFVEMSSLFIELEIQSVVSLILWKISVLYVCV